MKLLTNINDYIKKNFLSEKIERRFLSDINKSFTRLKTGQYEYHDYSDENIFRVDERTKDFFLYMKSYAETGRVWEKILKNIQVGEKDTIVDICAGWAPKVTLGCYYTGFTGKLFLLDKDVDSINTLKNFMKLFNTSYTLECLAHDIGETKKTFSICIANHIIDDILLNSFCKKENIDEKEVYKNEETLRYIWGQISDHDIFQKEISEFITRNLDRITKKEGIICISQYESMMEGILDLKDSVNISSEILKQVAVSLQKNFGYQNISHIGLRGISKKQGSGFYILKKQNDGTNNSVHGCY